MLHADFEASISCVWFPKSASVGTQERDCSISNGVHPEAHPEDRVRKGMDDMILMMKGHLFFHYKAIEVEGEKNSVDRCHEIIAEGEQVRSSFFWITSHDSTHFEVAVNSMRIIRGQRYLQKMENTTWHQPSYNPWLIGLRTGNFYPKDMFGKLFSELTNILPRKKVWSIWTSKKVSPAMLLVMSMVSLLYLHVPIWLLLTLQ